MTTGSADRTIRLTELLEKTTSLENLKQSDFKQLYDIFAASLNYRLDAGFLKETNQFSFTPVNGYQFPDSGLYYASILKNRPLGINPLNWLINEIKQKENN